MMRISYYGHWDWNLEIAIWDRGFGFGLEIGIWDWGVGLGIGIEDRHRDWD